MSKQTNAFQQLIAQIIELLEDPIVIEESKMFPDPHTGQPREVDVYALVRGKVNRQEITIAVECVDRSRKMDVTWVEAMYGKHSVLKAADVVLLVSKSGFNHNAETKAKKFGYKTITPVISPLKLKTSLGLDDGRWMGVQAATFSYRDISYEIGMPGQLLEDGWFYGADHARLVPVNEFYLHAATEFKGGVMAFAGRDNLVSSWDVDVPNPVHEQQALHVWIQQADGRKVLAPLQSVRFKARWSSTNTGHLTETERIKFNGIEIGVGVDTVGGQETRMVVATDAEGRWKGLTKFQYTPDIPENSLGGLTAPQ